MKHFGGFGLTLLTATGLFAQGHGGIAPSPVASSGFGRVWQPGAGAPVRPFRNFGGGFNGGFGGFQRNAAPIYAYPVPVYVGGGYGGYPASGYAPYGDAYGQDYSGPVPDQPPPDQPAQPNMTSVYPPPQYPPSQSGPPPGMYGPPPQEAPAPAPAATADTPDTPHYLIAFKDHTVYSAIAYWVDGETLHYFTSSDTHNQASLSMVDRQMTERLNREMGVDLRLPPAK
jgi:hypothetical protein